MDNLDLKQKCLLELSGELTPSARKQLIEEIANNPEACREYETASENYSIFGYLPFPEPSAAERREIPSQIKASIGEALLRPIIRARRARLLVRCAAMVTLVALIGAAAWSSVLSRAESRHFAHQIAQITAATDPVSTQKPGAYEQAFDDLAASIRQMEIGSPTLSNVNDKNLVNLLDALASVPQVYDTGDWAGDDWSTRY
jgi:hypothetical protein